MEEQQIFYGRATNIFSVSEHMVSAPDYTPAAPTFKKVDTVLTVKKKKHC